MATINIDFKVVGADKLQAVSRELATAGENAEAFAQGNDVLARAMKRQLDANAKLETVIKQVNKAIAKGNLDREEGARVIQQTVRELTENILVDKKLLAEEKKLEKQRIALDKQREKEAKRLDELKAKYDPLYAAEKRRLQVLEEIQDAQNAPGGGGLGADVAAQRIAELERDYEQFTKAIRENNLALIDSGNQFNRLNTQAYNARRSLQDFSSSGLQQVGYQVQDFIVQVQSGQDVLVALGQQGSQLAGIFGTQGALFGAAIAGATALASVIVALVTGVKSLDDAMKSLGESLDNVNSNLDILLEDPETFKKVFGGYSEGVTDLSSALRDLNEAALLENLKGAAESVASEVDAPWWQRAAARIGEALSQQPSTIAKVGPQQIPTQDLLDERGLKALGFDIGIQTYRNIEAGILAAAQVGDVDEVIKGFARLSTAISNSTTKPTEKGMKLLNDFAAAAIRTAKTVNRETAAELERQAKLKEQSLEAAEKGRQMSQDELVVGQALTRDLQTQVKARVMSNQELLAGQGLQEAITKNYLEGLKERKKREEELQNAIEQGQEKLLGFKQKEQDLQVQLLAAEGRKQESLDTQALLAGERAAQAVLAVASTEEERAALQGVAEEARKSAENAIYLANNIANAKEEARLLEAAVNAVARTLNTLANIGANIQTQIAVTRARIAALDAGASAEIAGRIETMNQNAKTAYEAAVEAADNLLATGGKALEVQDAKNKALEEYNAALAGTVELQQLLTEEEAKAKALRDAAAAGKRSAAAGEKAANAEAKKTEDMQKYLANLAAEVNFLEQTRNIFGDQLVIETQLHSLRQQYGSAFTSQIEQQTRALLEQKLVLEEQKDVAMRVGQAIGNAFGTFLTDIVSGTVSVEEAFKKMALSIINELFRILVVEKLVKSISNAFSGGFSQGAAFSGGNVVPFANGGVVGSPTFFPMASNSVGLMGEAGPEAIMPLKRGKDGKLGVEANNNSAPVVNQKIVNVLDPSVMSEYLSSRDGEKVIMNVIRRNRNG